MKNLSIFSKILIAFLLVSLTSVVVIGFVADTIFKKTLISNTNYVLENNLQRKKYEIERYFKHAERNAEIMSNFFSVKNLFQVLIAYHQNLGVTDSSSFPIHTKKYAEITSKYTNYFEKYIKKNDYNDILFICPKHGHIMFSVAHESDLGTNLSTGKYKDTHLAKLWKEVVSKKKTIISDYKAYAPSGNKQVSFIGTPVFEKKKLIGVLVIKFYSDKIDKIVKDKNKLYKSSETYIIGKSSDQKYKLKSDRKIGNIGDEKKTEIKSMINCIDKKKTDKILESEKDNGKPYILYYTPLHINGLHWGLFTKVNVEDIHSPVYKAEKVLLIISILIILLIIISAYWLSKSISNPIKKAVNAMKKIANKQINFEIKEKRKDEIGDLYNSLNKINENIRIIVLNIRESATAILDASNQLTFASQEISQRASEQAATTEEISASMEQMLATISSNTERAIITGESSKKSSEEMKESNEIFMRTIESVSTISKKISVITEIAGKTDILSINAAIEAARAGEIGKGFAVVAQEIRKLADKTKIASDEITELSINGQEVSTIAREKLITIIPEIIKSAELVNNIITASKEQQTGVESINTAIFQLSEITDQNSASAEEMSASAEELSAQAEQLKTLISVFKIEE